MRRTWCAVALLLLVPVVAEAAELSRFTPQGSVRAPRQASAQFSAAVVHFGDPRLPDPMAVDCLVPGQGRWVDGRHWVYDFDRNLPAGLRCTFTVSKGLRDLDGALIRSAGRYEFTTGGPSVRASLPAAGSRQLDAEQVFLLALDAPATPASIEARAVCRVPNLAEALKVVVLQGAARDQVLAQSRALDYAYYRLLTVDDERDYRRLDAETLARYEANLVVLRCARPLPDATPVDLIWGQGIATASGVATDSDQVLSYQTRAAFTAKLSCQRVNANAPCMPVLPLRLEFSAPVPREQAMQVRIEGEGYQAKPQLEQLESPTLTVLEFAPPFPQDADLRVRLPHDLVDDAGRRMQNAGSFPLDFSTGSAPPLAKFSGEFGILEWRQGGVLPVTLRDIEDSVTALSLGGQTKAITDEFQIVQWLQRVRQAQQQQWADGKLVPPGRDSVFGAGDAAVPFRVERPAGGKAFEVVGIPLTTPGFRVVELASPRLGAALLGEQRPRYVATSALVTNLAVHFQWGREQSLVFVSTLDGAKAVADATLRVIDVCDGRLLWQGRSGHDGIARIGDTLPQPAPHAGCYGDTDHPLMVSARQGEDFSFVLSDWSDGIAPSDFGLPSGLWDAPEIAHTVLDRPLYRAGEAVSMKHYWRRHTSAGLALAQQLPDTLVVQHGGSGDRYTLPLAFDAAGIAESRWNIPPEARLGEYQLRLLISGSDDSYGVPSGSLRVEQYRIPLMKAVVQGPAEPVIDAEQVPVDLFVGYFSGGGAAGLPVKLRTQLQPRSLDFPHYEGFSFDAEPVQVGVQPHAGSRLFPDADGDEAEAPATRSGQTLPLVLDAQGAARVSVADLPRSGIPQTLVMELEYPDANGEVSSFRAQQTLWPAAVVAGLRIDGWVAARDNLRLQVVVLDLEGKPVAGKPVAVASYQRLVRSYRKRLVGGFYAYSNSSEIRPLDAACRGRTDAQGLLSCKLAPGVSGNVVLEAMAKDDAGRPARAVASAWIAGDDDWWFAQGDSDRMDLIPERRELDVGETLRLQVRMPFRKATALVTVQREGVIDAFVTELSGREPVVEVPIKGSYAPNVYVSVMALRPRVANFASRLSDFLRWTGLDRWILADGGQATATVDLSKPAYRLGIASVDVGWTAHRLQVEVQPHQSRYSTRETAQVDVQVTPADGAALPDHAEIAFSAVDEALLDLLPNRSVNLLQAMMQRRGIEVLTATAQMQVVGRRHYGRKALAPGGGGGRGAPREMLDSLLLWKGRVALDAQGRATVAVPLNDALTAFRLTAVASAGADRFGEGHASIVTTQDFQLLSGLPPVVRENDRYTAVFTLRNTTDQPRQLQVLAEVTADTAADATVDGAAPPQQYRLALEVPANGAMPVPFDVVAPYDAGHLQWTVRVQDAQGHSLDQLQVSQKVISAYPVRVYQASLLPLDRPQRLSLQLPHGALPGRGGVRIGLQDSLTGSLATVREWMSQYPYTCYEQTASRAIALGDEQLWAQHMARLGTYLDDDGLLRYFPSAWLQGSEVLTAYVLSIADEAGWQIPQAERERMLDGLSAFVQGRLSRGNALNNAYRTERKLAALSALARYARARAQWLSSLAIEPSLWSTGALLDWMDILQRLPEVADRAARLEQVKMLLRSRMQLQGSTLGFSADDAGSQGWLMSSTDVNAARAILALLHEPEARDDLPRMIRGVVGRQRQGHWDLTTANAWGTLALQAFAAEFEPDPVSGLTRAVLEDVHGNHRWQPQESAATLDLGWPAGPAELLLEHQGAGVPWAVVQSRAALPLTAPLFTGYRISRTVTAVSRQRPDRWSVGDVARVRLDIDAQSDMSWVVVEDPVPAGSSVLGGGLGRDSAVLTQGQSASRRDWPAYEERRFELFRAYYTYVPKGSFSTEYTLRYNSAGHFEMPATRVEAMYAPEMFGALPNAPMDVEP